MYEQFYVTLMALLILILDAKFQRRVGHFMSNPIDVMCHGAPLLEEQKIKNVYSCKDG
jgi:hypothetical protein